MKFSVSDCKFIEKYEYGMFSFSFIERVDENDPAI